MKIILPCNDCSFLVSCISRFSALLSFSLPIKENSREPAGYVVLSFSFFFRRWLVLETHSRPLSLQQRGLNTKKPTIVFYLGPTKLLLSYD
jgi:hypothetical protein